MAKLDLCELVKNEAKEQERKQVVREKRSRFITVEEKVIYLIEQNYKPTGANYGDLDPVESCLLDTFVNIESIKKARINANSPEDAIKKTILFEVLTEVTCAKKEKYDISKMSMKQFSQYFALSLIESSMERLLKNPEEAGERLFEAMAKGKQESQIKKDAFYEFRKPNCISELVADKYLSLFKSKSFREMATHACSIHDLRYLLVADIYCISAQEKTVKKVAEYLGRGEMKKAAVYSILQSVKDDLFF